MIRASTAYCKHINSSCDDGVALISIIYYELLLLSSDCKAKLFKTSPKNLKYH